MARTNRARRRLTLLGILVGSTIVAGVGSYAGVSWMRSRAVAAAKTEGFAKFDAGDFEGALDPLSRYVAKNRSDVDSLLKLAACRAKVFLPNYRHLVDAAGFYREVLKLKPGNLVALNGLVEIYRTLRYGPELEKVADELLRYDPKNVAAIEARMAIAASRGEWKQAREKAEVLVSLEPTSYRWRALTLELIRRDEPGTEGRLAKVRSWIETGEPDGRYQLFLADIFRQLKDEKAAKAAATAAVDKGMPDATMLGVLVDLLDQYNMNDEVQRAIQKALDAGLPQADVVQMQVRRHFLAGRLEAAKAQLAGQPNGADPTAPRAEGKGPATGSLQLLRWRIKIAEVERDAIAADAAIAQLRAEAQGNPSDAERETRWVDAVQTSRGADSDSSTALPRIAMGQVQRALADSPSDSFLLLRAGDVALRAGEIDDAIRYFESALEVEGGRWPLAGVRAVSSLLAVGRTEQGFRLAYDLVNRFDDNVPSYFVFAQACDAISREGRTPSSVDPAIPSDITALILLEKLHALETEDNPIFLPPLIATLLHGESPDPARAGRLAEELLHKPKTPVPTLLEVAMLLVDQQFGDLPTRIIDSAKSRESDPMRIAIAKARLQIARGDAGLAKLAMRSALTTAQGPIRAELAQVQAEAAISEKAPEVVSLLSEVLKEGGNDIKAATFVLNQREAWDDEGIINAAVAKLAELIGETAPRTVLTNASRVLRFKRSTPQEIAKSIQNVDKVLEGNSKSTVGLVTLSRLFAASQPPAMQKAAGYMREAVDLQPGRLDLYPELIALLQASGDFPTANSYLQKFMRSSENDLDQTRMAAGLMVQQGQFGMAIPELERVAKQAGTEADLVALADAQRRLGRMEDAEKRFLEAMARPERSALSAMAYAEFLARAGRLDDARTMIEEDMKSPKPALTPANRAYLKARLELDYGDPALARPAVEEALQLAPNSSGVAMLAAREKLASGDSAGAIAFAKQGLAIEPNDQHLLALLSSLLMADPTSRAGSAETLNLLTGQNPALGELMQIVKACASPDGTVAPGPEQLAALVELTGRYPAEPSVWTVAIELHVAADKLEEAVRLARSGMARLPADPGPAQMAARLLLQLRRPDEARDAARAWRSLTADSPIDADLVLARIALIAGRPKDAVETLQPYATRLINEGAKGPESLGLYAAALLFDGNVDRAFGVIRDGLERESKEKRDDRPLLAEWLRAIRTAPTAASLDALTRSEPILSGDDTGRGALATEFIALARRHDASAAADRAATHLAALSPEAKASPVSQLLQADLTAIRGDAAGASALYQAAWDNLPAEMREKLLRWSAIDEGTRQSLMGARSIALFAANNQASTLAKANTSLDVAMGAIERALVMAPGDVSLLETKAEVLIARKEYDEARQILTPIVARPDVGPSPRITLARVEILSGRLDDARRQVQAVDRILSEDPFADRTIIEALADVKRLMETSTRKPTA